MKKSLSPKTMKRIAVVFCIAVLGLLTFGVIVLCSTSSFYAKDRFGDPYFLFKRQVLWVCVGLAACAITASIDYRRYKRWAWWILGITAAMLLAVLIFGPVRNGAQRWLPLGPLNFQPSEFAKFGLVIFLAFWLEQMHRPMKRKLMLKIEHPWWGFGVPLLATAGLAALIYKQPDLGTTLLLFVVAVFLMWIAGTRPLYLGSFVAVGTIGALALLTAILHFGLFAGHYQADRIVAWWTGADPQGINFQQAQAVLAYGSGGPWGVGLGNSRQKMFYLPEAHTDFIHPIIGEELGLIGTLATVVAFSLLVVCGVLMASCSVDLFGLLVGSGIVFLIAMQAIINIAVVTNSVPNKGMPLPFISYGGSNVMMALAAIGILLNIYRQSFSQAAEKYVGSSKKQSAAI